MRDEGDRSDWLDLANLSCHASTGLQWWLGVLLGHDLRWQQRWQRRWGWSQW
jgi:hypothetical protein